MGIVLPMDCKGYYTYMVNSRNAVAVLFFLIHVAVCIKVTGGVEEITPVQSHRGDFIVDVLYNHSQCVALCCRS